MKVKITGKVGGIDIDLVQEVDDQEIDRFVELVVRNTLKRVEEIQKRLMNKIREKE